MSQMFMDMKTDKKIPQSEEKVQHDSTKNEL